MAFVPTPLGIRHEFLYTFAGQRCENVFHAQGDPSIFNPTDFGINNVDLIAWWRSTIAPLLSQDITLRAVRSTDIRSGSGFVVETAPATACPGLVAEEAHPTNVAVVMTQRTAKRGRSYRGRTYVPAIPKTEEATPTDIGPTDLSALVSAWASLIARELANGAVLAVLSTIQNGAPLGAGVLTPITSIDANTAFDSQRRRLAGRGN